MMNDQPLSEERLAQLLIEAKEAHARYEAETGQYDEDWPRWYARFILDRIEPDGDQPSAPESAMGPTTG